ncbi:MAG: NAD-dependent epimerase/dehydratase family protein [Euryarchaeota archaeon]|nr:NAD-dependent epimerase/dehydratase family protein [Euryarchaeota archaeon]
MNILVTGGAGFIGSHLVDSLVRGGHRVTVYDNLEPQVHRGRRPIYLNPRAKFVRGRVGDTRALRRVLRGQEAIYHLAARVGVGQSMYQIRRYTDANTGETARLLELLISGEHDVKKLIVASSMSAYGEGAYDCPRCGRTHPGLRPEAQLRRRRWEVRCPRCRSPLRPVPTPEEKPFQPTSIYAITKRDQEEMCLAVGRAYGLPAVAMRFFNVYGPRQSLSNPYTGVCAVFMSRIKNHNPPMIFEDGLQTRDFIHVSDIVQGLRLALRKSAANYQTYNVGTGRPTSIRRIAETLLRLYGSPLKPTIAGQFRAGDIRHCYADITRLKKLGYKPKVGLKEGLAELAKWGEGEKARDRFDQALEEIRKRRLVT